MSIDKAQINIASGAGGKGAMSFRREKFVPHGGPNGGNGGKGGDIIIQGDPDINTLWKFKFEKNFIADKGGNGGGSDKAGKDAPSKIIKVPLGTIIKDEENLEIEILDEKPILILKGGRGGIGNGSLANSVNKAPMYTLPPDPSKEKKLFFNLRMIGHVGLIGLPNAGKSSFIRVATGSKSKVASYAFTTMEPNIGKYNDLIIVDLPGIIYGASEGKGLGLKFLEHATRCKILLHLVDINNDPIENFNIVQNEVIKYGIEKEVIVCLNKIELIKSSKAKEIRKKFIDLGFRTFLISCDKKVGFHNILKKLETSL